MFTINQPNINENVSFFFCHVSIFLNNFERKLILMYQFKIMHYFRKNIAIPFYGTHLGFFYRIQ